MDVAISNGHGTVAESQPDGASIASSEEYNHAPPSEDYNNHAPPGEENNDPPSPSSSYTNEQMLNGSVASATRPKDPTDRFGFTGGKQFTKDSDWNTPVQVIRRREIKWLDMLDDWDKWMSKKPKKVRERCRKGIPCSIRSRAWQHLCGSKKLYEQNKASWEELDTMEGDPKWLEIIQKDLDRQFPFHEMFASRDGHGQQDLFRILKAYSIYNPRDGYCQAQAPVAAVLLMHMPAEDAFWALVQICEKYLTGYYSPGLEAVQIDGQVLAALMKKESPTCHKHMKKHRIEPILYMTEWFMCIFSRTLPWPSVLRVWDMFLCEGVKVLFRVGLVLLKQTLGRSDKLADCQGLYETMEALKNIPAEITQEDFLASEMLKLRVFEKDLEEEHSLSLARRRIIKERQLAPAKAAAMARDIDKLRKKKRGKVKPPSSSFKQEGFGSQDLLALERGAAQDASPRRDTPRRPSNERFPDYDLNRSPSGSVSSGVRPKFEREVHVDNPSRDWSLEPRSDQARSPSGSVSSGGQFQREIHVDNPPRDWNLNSTEPGPISPTSGKDKSPKGKNSKKEEKKKEKAEKKKSKSGHKEDVASGDAIMGGEKEAESKTDKKDKKKSKKEEKKEEKKMKKSDKKHKDKSGHSSDQHSSPIDDHFGASGNEAVGWHDNGRGIAGIHLDDHHFTAAAPPTHHEMNIPTSLLVKPAEPKNTGTHFTGDHHQMSPGKESESFASSPPRQGSHLEHNEETVPFPSVGLETPV
ncbi:carabin-like [Asterias rubens]|uniref:carabin-like n=1 Tax=Asterias rubens TaxID=7604 RepID=UPI0014552E3C|nr:carabin-like [Asterias rubens]XP_033627939.1 carabin-like [Asterias rubens]